MKVFISQPGTPLLAAAALVVAAAGGTAAAAHQLDPAAAATEPTRITVCVGAKADHLRLVPNRTTSCRSGEKLLSWNRTGRAGNGAYYIATLHGYEGTREQWLADLEGADGADGADGTNGTNGSDGSAGVAGQDGLDGTAGANGTDGSDGADGAAGLDGLNAYELAADEGFQGTRSEWLASLQGADGPEGPQGVQGPEGAQGPEGPQGPAGSGVSADSYYDLTFGLTSMTNSTLGITFGCHEGDVAISYHFSLASGDAALIHAMPQGTRSYELGFKGTTNANTDSVGVRCLTP